MTNILAQEQVQNYKYVIENQKSELKAFFDNVFSLYPSQSFISLLEKIKADLEHKGESLDDHSFYQKLTAKISTIKKSFHYKQLVSLWKQQKVMSGQTIKLLKELNKNNTINGYLEVGTVGRYVSYLEAELNFTGKTYLLNDKKPGMVDIGDYLKQYLGDFFGVYLFSTCKVFSAS
ncbi:MAG: hypothetical protein K2X39_06885, partial [Silvanigrellaceae bacterium]|nr:hypothetical protein [Silvanigrellaceae bacterium]